MINVDFYSSGKFFKARWNDTEKLFLKGNPITWVNFAYLGMSNFPDDYA